MTVVEHVSTVYKWRKKYLRAEHDVRALFVAGPLPKAARTKAAWTRRPRPSSRTPSSPFPRSRSSVLSPMTSTRRSCGPSCWRTPSALAMRSSRCSSLRTVQRSHRRPGCWRSSRCSLRRGRRRNVALRHTRWLAGSAAFSNWWRSTTPRSICSSSTRTGW
ncbi:MAG: hypothetical protein MZW92_07685 [Comamonadaceae bacterium]|nr:hypothetical protein [Comamonadaceae bacterium]